jgi:glutamate synthase domain-containing protein 2
MGVPGPTLPLWDDIQILAAQMATKPLLDDVEVGTELVIGPKAQKTLELKIPIFVSDMSFGALSEEAKTALAKGAELAGTGICSGEGVDYIILDGRGGGTGAAPLIFRNNISIPTIPSLARARHYLNKRNRRDITLIITGGIRVPADFIKALCLGADGVAISNSAMQAVGCIAARMCNTNNCPAGIATQNPKLAPN